MKIIITQITNINERESKDKNKYLRISMIANEAENNNLIEIKTSLSHDQWGQMKEKLQIKMDEKTNDILVTNPVIIEFDEKGVTNSQYPKPFFELKKGVYNGKIYEYYNLNAAVLITNNIIQSRDLKKDLAKFL